MTILAELADTQQTGNTQLTSPCVRLLCGISVSRRGLPAEITSNNSFSLGDKSPFLGADILVLDSYEMAF